MDEVGWLCCGGVGVENMEGCIKLDGVFGELGWPKSELPDEGVAPNIPVRCCCCPPKLEEVDENADDVLAGFEPNTLADPPKAGLPPKILAPVVVPGVVFEPPNIDFVC